MFNAINEGKVPPPYDTPGIGGKKVSFFFIDEAGGATKQVSEFRNMVQRQKVDVVMGYISSGDCLAIPAVAEELNIKPATINKAIKIAHKGDWAKVADAFDDLETLVVTVGKDK